MNTTKKHLLLFFILVSGALLIVLSSPSQDPRAPYVVRRDFLPKDSSRYCFGLDTWVVEVQNKELFYQKLNLSNFDTILWVEQVLFLAKYEKLPMTNIVLGDSANKKLFFSFCTPPEIGEKQILEVFHKAGF